MEYLKYKEFKECMNKGNIREIINKYKNNKSQYLAEIIKLLPNGYPDKIKAKIEDKKEFEKINETENYDLKLKNKTTNKSIYYYYNNIEIMNEEIFNYIKDILNIQNGNKKEYLLVIMLIFLLFHQF